MYLASLFFFLRGKTIEYSRECVSSKRTAENDAFGVGNEPSLVAVVPEVGMRSGCFPRGEFSAVDAIFTHLIDNAPENLLNDGVGAYKSLILVSLSRRNRRAVVVCCSVRVAMCSKDRVRIRNAYRLLGARRPGRGNSDDGANSPLISRGCPHSFVEAFSIIVNITFPLHVHQPLLLFPSWCSFFLDLYLNSVETHKFLRFFWCFFRHDER